MLDVPMYFVYREGKYIDVSGESFRDFMEGSLTALPGVLPNIDDWEDHLTTAFPEVRLKKFIEMRGADGGSSRNLCALPAFWVGLLYDEFALADSISFVADWSFDEVAGKMESNIVRGLKDMHNLAKKHKIDNRRAAMALAVQRVLEAFELKGIWP